MGEIMLLQQQDRGRTEKQHIYKDAAHNNKNIVRDTSSICIYTYI